MFEITAKTISKNAKKKIKNKNKNQKLKKSETAQKKNNDRDLYFMGEKGHNVWYFDHRGNIYYKNQKIVEKLFKDPYCEDHWKFDQKIIDNDNNTPSQELIDYFKFCFVFFCL